VCRMTGEAEPEREAPLPTGGVEGSVHEPREGAPVSGDPSDVGRRSSMWGPLPTGVAVLGMWLLGMVSFYREVVASGFDRVQANLTDPRLLVFISEHWRDVLGGRVGWRDLPFFYPATGTLGISDALLLHQVAYQPMRMLGVDPFVSFQVTLMMFVTVGFASMFVLLRRVLGVRLGFALAGAFTFAFANNIAVKSLHGQLYAVQLLPVLALLVVAAHAAARRREVVRSALWSSAAGLLLAAVFMTSFYVGWFALFIGLSVALGVTVTAWPVVRQWWRWVVANPRDALVPAGVGMGAFAVGLIPFAALYLPVLGTSGSRSSEEMLALASSPEELLNLGKWNLLWGRVVGLYDADAARQMNSLTPILWLSSIVLVAVLFWALRHHGVWVRLRLRVATGALAAVVVLLLVSLRIGGRSIWEIVLEVVPGAQAIRAVSRIQLVLGFVLVLVWAAVVDLAWGALRAGPKALRGTFPLARIGQMAIVAVAFLVVVEQIQIDSRDQLEPAAERALVDAVPAPPPGCSAFFVVNPSDRSDIAVQLDAALIGQHLGVPTLNGYGGLPVPGWWLVGVDAPDYLDRVRAWAGYANLSDDLCALDLTAMTWSGPGPVGGR